MTKHAKGLVFIMAALVLAVALFITLLDQIGLAEILAVFLKVRLWHIGVILGLTLVYLLIFNWRWKRILKIGGYDVSFKDLLFYRLAGYAVSYLTPAADFGGEPIMAHLLSKDYKKITFTASFTSIVINRLVALIPNITMIMLGFLYAFTFFVLPNEISFVFYIVLGVLVTLFIFSYFMITRRPLEKFIRFTGLYRLKFLKENSNITKIDEYMENFFHHNPREVLINMGLSLLSILALISNYWAMSRFLGFDLNFFEAIMAQSIEAIVSAMPVPANIGLAEAGEAVWFGILGIGAASGFSFYLIMRTKDIFYSLLGLVALLYKGVGKETMALFKEAFRLNDSR